MASLEKKHIHALYIWAVTDFCAALKKAKNHELFKDAYASTLDCIIQEWDEYVSNPRTNGSLGFDDETLLKCFKNAKRLSLSGNKKG